MCGRVVMKLAPDEISDLAKKPFIKQEGYYPSFNTGPTRLQPIITKDSVILAKWGFTGSHFIINRRIESTERPLYSLTNHCVVMCEAYFEWKEKQPYCIKSKSKVFYMAGLYGEYRGELVYVIITMPASDNIAPVHSRMPALLTKDEVELWLHAKDFGMLQSKNEGFEYFPVWKNMGKVTVDDMRNVQPIEVKKGFKQPVFDFTKKQKKVDIQREQKVDIQRVNETLGKVLATFGRNDLEAVKNKDRVKNEKDGDIIDALIRTESDSTNSVKREQSPTKAKKRKGELEKPGTPKNRKITDFFKK
ncbi:hypothetical protein HDV01_005806 [Terramyces sp. JEL0728]|nr:hypothetical protein HDV01_005806 [Terramyces sp. JEL0728]